MLGDYPMVILFYWDVSGSQATQLFSVASGSQKGSVKARAIVTHIGSEETGGEWLCSKDGKGSALCTHLRLAEKYLQDLVGGRSGSNINDDATSIPLDVCKCLEGYMRYNLFSCVL
jgi:hypothetical protein